MNSTLQTVYISLLNVNRFAVLVYIHDGTAKNLAHFSADSTCSLQRDFSPLQQERIQIAPRTPFSVGNILEPNGRQHKRRFADQRRTNHACAAIYPPVQPLDCVIDADTLPVFTEKRA